MNPFQHGGNQTRRRRPAGGDEMLDKFRDQFALVRHLIGAQPEHKLQCPPHPATFPDVVDDHEPVIRRQHPRQQRLGLDEERLVQVVAPGDQHQLLNQRRQTLGKNNVRRLGILVLVVVEQFQKKRELVESQPLGAGGFGVGLAILHLLEKLLQRRALLGRQARLPGQKGFKSG